MNENPLDAAPEVPQSSTPISPIPEFDQEPATQPQTPGEMVTPETSVPVAASPAEDVSPAVAPVSPVQPETAPSAPAVGRKSKSKRPLILGVVVATLLVLFGGGAAVYAFWYQNPDRVVAEAMMKMVSADNIRAETTLTSDYELAPGLIDITFKQLTVDASASTQSSTGQGDIAATFELNGRAYTIGAEGKFTDAKTMYFKLVGIKDFVTKVAADFGEASPLTPQIEKAIDGLQNRWVRVELNEMTDESETVSCIIDTTKKVSQDERYTEEAKKLYMDNKFFVITDTLGSKDGNLGYKVELDREALKGYLEASQSTKAAEEFKKCPGYDESVFNGKDQQSLDDVARDNASVNLVVWVSRFGHELRQVDYTLTSERPDSKDLVFEGSTKLHYDAVRVEAPKESVDLEVWHKEFEQAMETASANMYEGAFSPAATPTGANLLESTT